ncbi:hypothetical protein [Streptomyces exfoliatus]|uniref:hypothetical protein n=1 Tax=Streptomyces exfoliatus TaxID=1905 RepID=UPI000AD020B4|nr:hypothetical protein [Streptomyces exfoliatus]
MNEGSPDRWLAAQRIDARIEEIRPEAERHVVGQHVISQVLFKRFATPFGSNGASTSSRPIPAARIAANARARSQPLARRRRQHYAAATGGITVQARDRFGYTAPVGTTDDGRFRRLTVHLAAVCAQRLFTAREMCGITGRARGR